MSLKPEEIIPCYKGPLTTTAMNMVSGGGRHYDNYAFDDSNHHELCVPLCSSCTVCQLPLLISHQLHLPLPKDSPQKQNGLPVPQIISDAEKLPPYPGHSLLTAPFQYESRNS